MHTENLSRLGKHLQSQGIEAAVLANPFNITWLTGYAPQIQTGPSPFEGGPAVGWVYQDTITLLLTDWEAGPAEASGAGVHPYIGYTVDEPLDCTKRMAIELGEMLKPFGSLKGKVGVEMNQMPAALFARLQEALPKAQLVSLDRQLDAMRAVKSPEEIKKIRAALHLADLAQFELVKHIRPGITELELWTLVKSKVELEAGCRVPVLVDLVAGTRTAEIGGPPGDYALQDGDPVMLDFVPRLDGYWGDNCAGYFVGEPGRALQKVYEAVKGCLQASAEAIKPGMRANELDAKLRAYIRQAGFEPYPHHSGHGLGATFHDEPRIVPNHAVRLEPGMVLVLEPGIYLSGVGGVRLEDAYLVTADGCEVLTTHLSQS